MDQLTVDFGNAVPKVGDNVLLMGEGQDGTLRAEEIGKKINATTYQLFTAIGGRTERIFME